jgi:hypothetical protein
MGVIKRRHVNGMLVLRHKYIPHMRVTCLPIRACDDHPCAGGAKTIENNSRSGDGCDDRARAGEGDGGVGAGEAGVAAGGAVEVGVGGGGEGDEVADAAGFEGS